MPKKSGRKSRSKAKRAKAESQQPPHPNAMEDIAEEMINGIFCHYEPADENTRYKGILRKPRHHRRVHSDSGISGSAGRRVRWSDLPSSTFNEEHEPQGSNNNPLMMPFGIVTSCTHEAIEAGVERAERDSAIDYDLVQSFSEDSNGIIRRRESRAHHNVVFDDEGNPVPVKPGAQVDMPPPRPPPKKKETFIPELCGVKIGSEDDERTYNGTEEIPPNENTAADGNSKDEDGYQRPDHSRYRPSWEYTDEDDNSLIDDEKAKQASQKNGQVISDQEQKSSTASGLAHSMPPPPPPPPPSSELPSMMNHPNLGSQASSFAPGSMTSNFHSNLPISDEDWVGDQSGRSDCSLLFGSNAHDWDQSLAVIPKKRTPADPPKLDAPGSRDSQEENKPERADLFSPNGGTAERGTEMKWKDPSPRRRSFFTRGRDRDKRQSLPGRVEVVEEDRTSQISKTSQRSFLGLRNRSRSPGRRRMFGRSKSGNDVDTASNHGPVAEDDEKQSFIGAYRDSMNETNQPMNYPVPVFHPAHPLSYGMWMMPKDDAMERQSFITAYRESMEPADSKANNIAERLRRIRAQKTGMDPVDLDKEVDDEAFDRQSMITAHRETFEGKGQSVVRNRSLHPQVPSHDERKEGDLNGENSETSWEQRTRQALERIRCGADESSTLPSPRAEIAEDAATGGNLTNKIPDSEEAKDSNQESKTKTQNSQEKSDTSEEVSSSPIDGDTTTAGKMSTMLSFMSISSNDAQPANAVTTTTTPPLKSILKSPGSGKRVSFGVDQERIFHDDHNENQATVALPQPPNKTGSSLGKDGVQTQATGRSPLLDQTLGQPSPLQAQVPYMYPPYPQPYPQMMPSTSPMNSNQMMSPSFASDSSVPPQMPFGWPIPPAPSGDSSQQSAVPPYMAPPPYYYGYPPNYGGFAYPPPPVMQNNEEKKKKKRVFRGRKLLSAMVGKGGGRQADTGLGSATLSSSYSGDGPAESKSVDQSMQSPVKA